MFYKLGCHSEKQQNRLKYPEGYVGSHQYGELPFTNHERALLFVYISALSFAISLNRKTALHICMFVIY